VSSTDADSEDIPKAMSLLEKFEFPAIKSVKNLFPNLVIIFLLPMLLPLQLVLR